MSVAKTPEEKAALDKACPPGLRVTVEAFVIHDETGINSKIDVSGRLDPTALTAEWMLEYCAKAIEAVETATGHSGFRMMTSAEIEEYRKDGDDDED